MTYEKYSVYIVSFTIRTIKITYLILVFFFNVYILCVGIFSFNIILTICMAVAIYYLRYEHANKGNDAG